jgi:hypothetical protein
MLAPQLIDIRLEFPQLLQSPAHGGRPDTAIKST